MFLFFNTHRLVIYKHFVLYYAYCTRVFIGRRALDILELSFSKRDDVNRYIGKTIIGRRLKAFYGN